jgi:hypothetical protein
MLLLLLLGLRFDDTNVPFLGVKITVGGTPHWGPIFFVCMVSIVTVLTVIPVIRTSLKIYYHLETKVLKRKWLYYLIGSLGSFSLWYMVITSNLLVNVAFTLITGVYGISVILWGALMYYGISSLLDLSDIFFFL